jgi:hypothetical protein
LVTVAAKLSPPAADSTSSSAIAENTAPAASEVTRPSSHTDAGSRRAPPRASMMRPAYASGYIPTYSTSAWDGTGMSAASNSENVADQ